MMFTIVFRVPAATGKNSISKVIRLEGEITNGNVNVGSTIKSAAFPPTVVMLVMVKSAVPKFWILYDFVCDDPIAVEAKSVLSVPCGVVSPSAISGKDPKSPSTLISGAGVKLCPVRFTTHVPSSISLLFIVKTPFLVPVAVGVNLIVTVCEFPEVIVNGAVGEIMA